MVSGIKIDLDPVSDGGKIEVHFDYSALNIASKKQDSMIKI